MSRANEDIKLDLPFLSVEDEEDKVELSTELESLIIMYVSNRKRLSKKMRKLLCASVVANGKTWFSPEAMWIHDRFKQWAEERLIWLSAQNNIRPEQAVYLIRNYGAPVYGWLDWLDKHNKILPQIPQSSPNKIEKLSYGE